MAGRIIETMKQHTDTRPRLTVSLDEADRRALVTRAAERSLEQGRPVSVAEVVREALHRDLQPGGEAA
jgi:hypothetical protein